MVGTNLDFLVEVFLDVKSSKSELYQNSINHCRSKRQEASIYALLLSEITSVLSEDHLNMNLDGL